MLYRQQDPCFYKQGQGAPFNCNTTARYATSKRSVERERERERENETKRFDSLEEAILASKTAMVSCLLKRIPQLFVGSTIGLLFMLLILQACVTRNNHHANALPQRQLATQKHRTNSRQHYRHIPQQQQQQQQQQLHRHELFNRNTDTIRLSAAIPFYATDVQSNKQPQNKNLSPPFLIESITSTPGSGDAIYKSVANLCIDVFFREQLDPSGKGNVK